MAPDGRWADHQDIRERLRASGLEFRVSVIPSSSPNGYSSGVRDCTQKDFLSHDLLLKATRGVTIAVVSSRERKRRQPGLATDDPAFVGWHQLVRGIQGS
jgi:hypothetical protein